MVTLWLNMEARFGLKLKGKTLIGERLEACIPKTQKTSHLEKTGLTFGPKLTPILELSKEEAARINTKIRLICPAWTILTTPILVFLESFLTNRKKFFLLIGL